MSPDGAFEPELDAGRWQRLQEHFAEALELAADKRSAQLARLAAEDASLAAEVGEMLHAHDTTPLAIEEGVLASEATPSLLGQRIGPYRILELIGRGGMGEVYLAERDDQYRQRVALKVVRAGFAGRDLRARFRVERQILARLAHANIARLLDGGVTEDGRPYLVMEHIEGVPLTDWCDTRQLSIDARLELLVTACRAVAFAHRSLVVHRDLKPSNIPVTEGGEVKLLDFGIAKLLDPEAATGASPETGTGFGLMTPEHAAPEQVRGEAVTTVTDVYALGVLLYELLCGQRPFRLEERPLAELLKDVCERDPPPPSAVAARGPAAGVAAARSTTPADLRRRLAGDLDAIVLKALRKEPEQRYRSAEQLAEDLRRHLGGLPVMARQGTSAYRTGRFLRRHAAAVAAGGMFVALLVGFSVVTLIQSREVARERDRARAESDTAEQVVGVLVGMFQASDPTKVPGGDTLTVGQLLARNEERILRQLDAQPGVQARVQSTLGEMYLARSDLEPAERHLKAALSRFQALRGERSPEAAAVYHKLAQLSQRRGSAEAVPMLRRSLAGQQQLYGAESAAVATGLQDLAGALPPAASRERQELLHRSLSMRRRLLPAGHPEIAMSIHALGLHHLEGGRLAEAERLLREARSLLEPHPERGPEHPSTLAVLEDLAAVYNRSARFEEAESVTREALARRIRVFGAESAAVAVLLNNLGVTQVHRGDLEGAFENYTEARRLYARLLGREHWETTNTVRNLAVLSALQGRYGKALPLMREAYQAYVRRRGEGERGTCVVRGQLGALLARTGERSEGLALVRRAYTQLDAMFPDGHMHVADTAVGLARALLSGTATAAELAEAERAVRRALEIRAATLAADHPKRAEAACWLGIVLAATGRAAEARPLLQQGLPIFAGWGFADPEDLREARRRLAEAEATATRMSDSRR